MFRFTLEFLLRYRRQKEETAMHALAQRVRAARQVEEDIARVRQRAGQLVLEQQALTGTSPTAALLSLYSEYLHQLRVLVELRAEDLAQANREADAERRKLRQASIERKIMERLKEIQRQAYLEEAARQETKTLDEFITIRSRRTRS
jgi:flagellar export protein FliJ